MDTKFKKAAEHYLRMSGYAIIYTDFLGKDVIVANTEDGIAFVHVHVDDDMSNHMSRMKKDEFEDMIYKFFYQEHDPVEAPIRYDTLELFVVKDDRAIIRYRVNAELED